MHDVNPGTALSNNYLLLIYVNLRSHGKDYVHLQQRRGVAYIMFEWMIYLLVRVMSI